MQKVENTTISRVFCNTFEEIDYKYQTRFSKDNFKQPLAFINCAKFSVFSRGPQLWNRLLYFSNLVIFKVQIKEKLFSTDNELDYFQIQEMNKKHPKDNAYIYFFFKDGW